MSEAVSPPSTSAARPLTVNDLIELVLNSSHTLEQKKTLIDEVRKTSPALNDRWLYRYVVWSLGLAALLSVVGFITLGALEVTIPQGLVALGSAAIGGLAGLFTSSSRAGLGEPLG
jgi:hypothetical protein